MTSLTVFDPLPFTTWWPCHQLVELLLQTHKVFLHKLFMHVPLQSCAICYRMKATLVDRFTRRVCEKKKIKINKFWKMEF